MFNVYIRISSLVALRDLDGLPGACKLLDAYFFLLEMLFWVLEELELDTVVFSAYNWSINMLSGFKIFNACLRIRCALHWRWGKLAGCYNWWGSRLKWLLNVFPICFGKEKIKDYNLYWDKSIVVFIEVIFDWDHD